MKFSESTIEVGEQPGRPREILVMYKGGGYDGCWWEPNFGLFDHLGRWHEVNATGYMGIKKDNAVEAMKRFGTQMMTPDGPFCSPAFADPTQKIHEDFWEMEGLDGLREWANVCRYTDEADLRRFLLDLTKNAGLLIGVGNWLDSQSHYGGHITSDGSMGVRVTCGVCGCETDITDIHPHPHDYVGDGGIGVHFKSVVCTDCLYDVENEDEEDEENNSEQEQD